MAKLTHHIDNHPLLRAIEHEFITHPATEAAREDWEHVIGMVRERSDRTHAEAALIMQAFQVTRRPFGLFLRNFEIEAYDYLTPEVDGEQRQVVTALRNPGSVEEKLAAALEDRLPLLGIANPSNLLGRSVVPRLTLPNDGWQAVVENLIAHAHVIVMDCQSLAPGVQWELDAIVRAGRQDAAILVLPPRTDEAEPDALRDLVEVANAVITAHEQPTLGHPQLAPFPRKAYEDAIPFDRLDESPLFADLLAEADAKTAEAPPFDALRHATWLNNEGVARLNEKRFAEALDLHAQAMVIRRHLDDRPGLLSTFLNIGITYSDAAQPADALPYFYAALELADELDRKADQGLLKSYLGVAHHQLGQAEEAQRWLVHAYALQHAHGEPADVENTLSYLAELYKAEQNGDGMVDAYTELRAYHRARGDAAGELEANLKLTVTYYTAGLIPQTITLLEEGIRLSRALGDQEKEDTCAALLQRLRAQAPPP